MLMPDSAQICCLPSFPPFILIPQDFGYFLGRQGAGQAEEVHHFAGGDPVPGDTSARYASPSQYLLCHRDEEVHRLGAPERTGHTAKSHRLKSSPKFC